MRVIGLYGKVADLGAGLQLHTILHGDKRILTVGSQSWQSKAWADSQNLNTMPTSADSKENEFYTTLNQDTEKLEPRTDWVTAQRLTPGFLPPPVRLRYTESKHQEILSLREHPESAGKGGGIITGYGNFDLTFSGSKMIDLFKRHRIYPPPTISP